ncbi:MAG: hypothetical protein AAGC81_01840 [Pseudomonadota bacterium]
MPLNSAARLWLEPTPIYTDVTASLEFLTDIQSFQNGDEQRRALRNEPRRALRYTHSARNSDARRIIRNFMGLHQDDWAVPDRTRAVAGGSYEAGATQITAAETRNWMINGESVAVVEGVRVEARTMSGVSGSTLTFVETNGLAWGADVLVMPLVSGRFEEQISTQQRVPSHIDISIAFDAKPEFEPIITPPAAPQTLDGFELWTARPMPFEAADLEFISNVSRIDYSIGLWGERKPVSFTSRLERLTWRFGSRSAHQEFEDLFLRMKGQRGEFYMPTWQEDFNVLGTASSGSNTIDVVGDVDLTLGSSEVWRAIAVEFNNGTVEAHKIQSIASLGNNATITIDGTWGADVSAGTVERVMWCPRWRFATDTLQTLWRVADYPQVRIGFRTLLDQA